jgi:erlin
MLARFLLSLFSAFAMALYFSAHSVHEGHIGIYFRGGAQLHGFTEPGLHFMIPFATRVAQVETRLQTDAVLNVPCGTSGGVNVYFDKIEVVNQLSKERAWQTIKDFGVAYDQPLVFDKVHHEINQFCSKNSLQDVYIDKFDSLDESLADELQRSCDKWNTGVTIIGIRVTKPRIPESVRKNYESMVEQATKLRVSVEQAKVTEREERTKQMRARMAAERDKEVATIEAQRAKEVAVIRVSTEIAEKEGEAKIADIGNQMHVERQKALADAAAYAMQKESEAMRGKLTPEFLKYTLFTSVANNSKLFFGTSIPQIFTPWQSSDIQRLLNDDI